MGDSGRYCERTSQLSSSAARCLSPCTKQKNAPLENPDGHHGSVRLDVCPCKMDTCRYDEGYELFGKKLSSARGCAHLRDQSRRRARQMQWGWRGSSATDQNRSPADPGRYRPDEEERAKEEDDDGHRVRRLCDRDAKVGCELFERRNRTRRAERTHHGVKRDLNQDGVLLP